MKQNIQSLSLVAGANLKRLLEEKGITQDKAAEMLYLTESSSVRRLIRNGIPKIDQIQRIASVFGVDITYMLTPLD